MSFVKSATTSTPVDKTQLAMMTMLRRYGAEGFGFRRIGNTIQATFHLSRQTVKVPIDLALVKEKMGESLKAQKKNTRTTDDQVERVAWRVLYIWIDAALSAVSLGVQTIEEAFFAHLVVTTDQGDSARMVDYIHTLRVANNNILPSEQKLLGAG